MDIMRQSTCLVVNPIMVFFSFLVFCYFPIWCSRSGVVFDCIDFWSLHSSLLLFNFYHCSSNRKRPPIEAKYRIMVILNKIWGFWWQSFHASDDSLSTLLMTVFPRFWWQSFHASDDSLSTLLMTVFPRFWWQSFHASDDSLSTLLMTVFPRFWWQSFHASDDSLSTF